MYQCDDEMASIWRLGASVSINSAATEPPKPETPERQLQEIAKIRERLRLAMLDACQSIVELSKFAVEAEDLRVLWAAHRHLRSIADGLGANS